MGTLCAQLLLQIDTDSLELYKCCDHALKICISFGYNPQIIFCRFIHNLNLVIFWHFIEWIEGTLCAQLLVQFNTDIFETLQTLCPCFEDMHVVGILLRLFFFVTFLCNLNFSIFRNCHILKVTYQLGA